MKKPKPGTLLQSKEFWNNIDELRTESGKLPDENTNIDLQTGIRYTSAYVNSQNISGEFIDDIITQGTDLGYTSWLEDAKSELKSILEDEELTTEDGFSAALKCSSCLDIGKGERAARIVSELFVLRLHEDDIDMIMESSGLMDYLNDRYESGSTKWLLEEGDLTVEYNNDDNSITILGSRFVSLLSAASPCFPNGCFMSEGGLIGYVLEFDCFDNYSIKAVDELPYAWIYDLQNDYFLQAVNADGHVEPLRVEPDDLDLTPNQIQDLKNAASAFRQTKVIAAR